MGKKKKKNRPEKAAKLKSGSSNRGFLILIGIVLLAAALFIVFSGNDKPVEAKKTSFNIQGGETRPVLDPAQFSGMTRAAYAAAKRYPQVLDQVRCYCNCDEPPFYHKSLLSCFVETHGAG
ncbi:MAG: hypothetical protein D6710_06665 [Nitrospirae bacterium]|nr:MAG: hypothetical protein D6710_06665 [Nitrospirota bacterium]